MTVPATCRTELRGLMNQARPKCQRHDLSSGQIRQRFVGKPGLSRRLYFLFADNMANTPFNCDEAVTNFFFGWADKAVARLWEGPFLQFWSFVQGLHPCHDSFLLLSFPKMWVEYSQQESDAGKEAVWFLMVIGDTGRRSGRNMTIPTL